MLFNKVISAISFFTAVCVQYAQAINPDDIIISVTSDNRIQIDISAAVSPFSSILAAQIDTPGTFAWSESGSSFLQCSSDNDCSPFNESDLYMNDDSPFQFAGQLRANPDDGKFVRFLTPTLSFPQYGVIPVSFAVYITGSKTMLTEYVATIYQLDPASSEQYTFLPTTLCYYGHCDSTSIPNLKQTVTSISNGLTTTIDTYQTISYQPVTVKSYATTATVVVDDVTSVITTYCPLTDA